ncbi:MAG TPA: DUF4147 domain-containing protein [Thermoplasmatales archaeon]|nr:DUF4147 domain-containing protein [Thermoplasmatales archaeon]
MVFKNREQLIGNGVTSELKEKRKITLEILEAALKAVDPYIAVKEELQNHILNNEIFDLTDFHNTYLIAFGKASIGMTKAITDTIQITRGVAITNNSSNKLNGNNIDIIVGGHPIPNDQSILGAKIAQSIVENCTSRDLLIVLISGGGSSLLCNPRVPLKDMQLTTSLLLRSGANINEINTIRKHLSYVKGGQLVRDISCQVITFIISDIIGDPIDFIASGPTAPDSTTFEDAKKIFIKYNLWDTIPMTVRKTIEDGIAGRIPETPDEDDEVFKHVKNIIVANNEKACLSAALYARKIGYNSSIITTKLTGEAKETGVNLIKKIPLVLDRVFIAGGETTVTVKGNGKGGRNQEMVLGCIDLLEDTPLVFTSFATDGIDGDSDAAGAIADGYTKSKANKNNLNPRDYLEDNNSYVCFKNLGDLLLTGPTGTNVMDIQVILT